MAGQGKTIRAASDQMASPTGADGLAAKVIELMENGEDGLYHVTGPRVSAAGMSWQRRLSGWRVIRSRWNLCMPLRIP